MSEHERTVLVDASAFITLAGIGWVELLRGIDDKVEIPVLVREEIVDEPASGAVERADDSGWLGTVGDPTPETVALAAEQLGRADSGDSLAGDVALLAHATATDDPVVVTDDKLLRKTCTVLGIPMSGSIGVVIGAVERGDLEPDVAKDALVAMDEVGARLSARLLRGAERLIDEVGEGREE